MEATNQAAAVLLPLDEPRVIKMHAGDKVFTWRFRRITSDDWRTYFAGIVHQTLHVNRAREEVLEDESAKFDLVDRTVISVDGYGDLSGAKNWKLSLPLAHRLAAAVVLRAVGVSTAKQDETPLCDLIEVRLDANWSAGEGETTTQYRGLVHRFRQPSIADLKRFNFESSRVRVSGDTENGTNIYPSRQAIAMKIYDDLIESVDGYSVGGARLGDTESVKREMDGAHKAEAALALFSSGAKIELL